MRTVLKVFLALTLGAVIGSAEAADAAKLKIEHASGVTEVRQNPAKVIVLDMAVLDTLDALNVNVTGVPGWRMPKALAKYDSDKYAKVGSVFEPNYEAINAAAPDLILISGRTHDKYAKLAEIAPTVDLTIDFAHYYKSVEDNARILGRIFGKQAAVEQDIAHLNASLARLHSLGEKAGTASVVLTTGGKMSTFGIGSRFGAFFADYGFKAADTGLKPSIHGQQISYEYLLKTNPDWIFVIDRDMAIGNRKGQPAQQLLDNPLVAQTKAWKAKHVVYLNPVHLYTTNGSLRSEQAVVDEVTSAVSGH